MGDKGSQDPREGGHTIQHQADTFRKHSEPLVEMLHLDVRLLLQSNL